MTENAASSPEHLPATKKTARIHFADDIIVIEEGKGETVTQPPLQQILRGPQPSHKKPKTSHRLSKNKNKQQSPRLSASHIEAAAGDVSDLTASLLLACLFCHFSDCLVLMPGTCFSSLRCLCAFSCLPDLCDLCCCSPSCCNAAIDCQFLDVCHHTAECLELAMEISELCFR
ncbi:myoD family inhibitor domain-containing protein 2-like isoform X1 [Hyperolius riggenbachi]|uniref:myoD family inhibitor domain-containing protein 2-like isoform X1 n=1 Tax=Hyperolius riggenbachi TaxID=752182 RepID=UPI0035A3B076